MSFELIWFHCHLSPIYIPDINPDIKLLCRVELELNKFVNSDQRAEGKLKEIVNRNPEWRVEKLEKRREE